MLAFLIIFCLYAQKDVMQSYWRPGNDDDGVAIKMILMPMAMMVIVQLMMKRKKKKKTKKKSHVHQQMDVGKKNILTTQFSHPIQGLCL